MRKPVTVYTFNSVTSEFLLVIGNLYSR